MPTLIQVSGAGASGAAGSAANGMPPAPWVPAYQSPISSDPIFSTQGFGVTQQYVSAANGTLSPAISVYGTLPTDPTIGLVFKVRQEFVSGVFAQTAANVTTNTINFGIGGAMSGVIGRTLSLLAKLVGSAAAVPIADFTVTGYNSSTGDFTVTPDPVVAAGCVAGDLFTLRTSATSTPTATTYTDSLWSNIFGSGLQSGGNVGNLALIIAGTGAGQVATVSANTATGLTFQAPGFSTVPDSTSVLILVEAIGQVTAPLDGQSSGAAGLLGTIPIPVYSGVPVHIEGYTSNGAMGPINTAPFRELYIWGLQGTSLVSASASIRPTVQMQKVNATGGASTQTCPVFGQVLGQLFTVAKTDASAHTVTVQTQGSDIFDDNTASVVLSNRGDSFTWRVGADGRGTKIALNLASGGGGGGSPVTPIDLTLTNSSTAITNPSGTFTNGQLLAVIIRQDATGGRQPGSWGSAFSGYPGSIVDTTPLTISTFLFCYSGSKWVAVGVSGTIP